MLRIAMTLFVLVLIAVGSFVVATTGHLTDPVATHFDRDFLANGWMTRDGYLRFTLAFATLVPVFVALAVGGLPRVAPRSVNLPNRDYWLAPERRATTLDGIAARACVLGALLAVFIAGVHALILQANATVPPQLPAAPFWTLLGVLLVVFAIWVGAFWRRYRAVPR
jgi:fructose-specific phosphotransferase system IIC component